MAFFKLNVPFKDKDEAKKFGAKWYSEDKYWYYSGDDLPEGLRRWYPLYKPVDGKEGVYLDTETGEIIGDSSEITPVNNETVNVLTGTATYNNNICLVEGTKIKLYDGSYKNIEDIK